MRNPFVKNGSIELLVFDLDGTLVDSRKDIAVSVNHALGALHLTPITAEEIVAFVGRGVSNLIRSVLEERGPKDMNPLEGKKLFKRAIALFREHYSEHLLDNTVLYPGVEEALKVLDRVSKAVITNKPTDYSVKILEGLGIRQHFRAILGGDFGGTKKPAPDALHQLMQQFSVDPERTMIVGDSIMDIEAGKNAGARTCAVLYGFGKKEDLIPLNPDYILNKIIDLKSIMGVE